MLLQNRYQRQRLYTRFALGKVYKTISSLLKFGSAFIINVLLIGSFRKKTCHDFSYSIRRQVSLFSVWYAHRLKEWMLSGEKLLV